MISLSRRKFTLILLWIFFLFVYSGNITIALADCRVSTSPTDVQPDTSVSFYFNIENTTDPAKQWVKITKPALGLTITGAELSGWNIDTSTDVNAVIFTGNLLNPYYPVAAVLHTNTGTILGDGNWRVQVSDSPDGSSPTDCSGSLGLTVSGSAPDTVAPEITNLTISEITSSSVVINWTTGEPTNAIVNYGFEYSGPLYESVTTLSTSHSVKLSTSIAAATSYYFSVCSADVAGNQTCTSDNTFTTQAYQAVATLAPVRVEVIVNATTTTSSQSTPTPTPKPLVDTVAPVVNISTDFSKPYLVAPTIEGKAFDGGDINVGVVGIEYSLDGGKNWLPVDNLEGEGKKSASFEFTPVGLDDGNYLIKMRARDSTGNVGQSKVYTMVVDRLPPQVGGVLYSLGPMILKPDENGRVMSIAGLEIKVTLGAVGGPVIMDLFYNLEKFSLLKNIESGLWSGVINLLSEGNYKLMVKSIDGAKNETERALNSIVSLKPGRVVDDKGKGIKGAKVKVYVFEKIEGDYVLWDGSPYGQENPQRTNEKGEYKLFLPAGKYFVEVEMAGKKKQRTEIFEIEKPTPMTNNFGLNKIKGFWNFWAEVVPIKLDNSKEENSEGEGKELVGKNLPSFDLSVGEEIFSDVSILGKPTVLTFISTWEPQTADQLRETEKLATNNSGINVMAVSVQESVSKTNIFKKVGGYDVKIMADPDGVLVEPLGLESLPRHLFLDRKGVIKETVLGFMTEKEMWQKVLE
jgi:peroxiredoxin